jgi:hypothetical protein
MNPLKVTFLDGLTGKRVLAFPLQSEMGRL